MKYFCLLTSVCIDLHIPLLSFSFACARIFFKRDCASLGFLVCPTGIIRRRRAEVDPGVAKRGWT